MTYSFAAALTAIAISAAPFPAGAFTPVHETPDGFTTAMSEKTDVRADSLHNNAELQRNNLMGSDLIAVTVVPSGQSPDQPSRGDR